MSAIFDRAASIADRHERLFTIGGAIWLALSCAAYARFIDLPEIPFVTDRNAWMFSGAYNAIWWGFIHPQIDKRRAGASDERDGESEIS